MHHVRIVHIFVEKKKRKYIYCGGARDTEKTEQTETPTHTRPKITWIGITVHKQMNKHISLYSWGFSVTFQ